MVVAEWQLLADLSFADFLMWVPIEGSESQFACVTQARPTTGATAHPEDVVGSRVDEREHPQLAVALRTGRIVREEEPRLSNGDILIRREAIPVRFRDQVIAVL